MFRYFLVLPDGEPHDPASFVSAIPNWSVGEVITFGTGEQARVLAIDTGIAEGLLERGFNGVFIVDPVH